MPSLPSSGASSVSPAISESSLTLDAAGYTLQARWTIPTDRPPVAAIVLIPGSLFVNVDGDMPAWNVYPHSQAHLARQLAERGFAVYRYSKSGPGTDTVIADAERVAAGRSSFLTRVEVAQVAWNAMREQLARCLTSFTNHTKGVPLIAAGHSEGAVVATLLARAEPTVRGVVLLAGPSVGILEIMIEQLPIMTPPNELDEARRVFGAVVEAIRESGDIPPELRASPYARSLAQMDAPSLSYMRTCDAVDPAAELAEVSQPVLIIQGSRDSSVPEHHAHRLRDARRHDRALDTDLAIFTRLQHFFKPLPDGVTGAADFGLEGDVDRRVAGAIEGWVRSVIER